MTYSVDFFFSISFRNIHKYYILSKLIPLLHQLHHGKAMRKVLFRARWDGFKNCSSPSLQAVLGVQLVVTLLTISIMQKVTQRFSFGKWLLTQTGWELRKLKIIPFKNSKFFSFIYRLVHYLHPSDYDLRKLAGFPQPKPKPAESSNKSKSKRKKNKEKDDKTFTVPRSLDVQVSRQLIDWMTADN